MNKRRHLDSQNFTEALVSGVPFELLVDGDPRMVVFIDQGRPEIGLRLPLLSKPEKMETGLENIRCRNVLISGDSYSEIVINDIRLFSDGYQILCLIADRVQIEGMSLSMAVAETIRLLGSLLRSPSGIPLEKEIGLFGELTTLRSLITSLGAVEAVGGWFGPQAEEHDFSLNTLDLEVKTTVAEARKHWVSSLTQLVPKVGKPLWLISHQVTAVGPHQGKSLSELVDCILTMITTWEPRAEFNRRLAATGWSDEGNLSSGRRYRARTAPGLYRIDEDFPHLTHESLASTSSRSSFITDVRYRLDLSNFPKSQKAPDYLQSIATGEIK